MNSSSNFSIAAYLAHPYLDMPVTICEKLNEEKLDLNSLHSVLKVNKVLYRTLDKVGSSNFPLFKKFFLKKLIDDSPLFHRSRSHAVFLKQRILEVVETFEKHQINLVFLKSLNTLPLDSDNFDVLVKDEDLRAAHTLLENLGYIEVSWVKEPYKRLFRKVRNAEDCLAFHLHTRISWDGMEFVDHSDVWKMYEEKIIDGVTVGFPSLEHHMLITLAHAFFENHCFNLGDLINTIEDIWSERKIQWDYLKQWVRSNNWSVPFYALLQFQDYLHESLFMEKMFNENDPRAYDKKKTLRIMQKLAAYFKESQSLPIPIPILIVSQLYVNKIIKSPKLPLTQKLHTIASLFGQYTNRRMFGEIQPSFLISFSGEDGTGKTTHARHLWNELKRRDIKTSYIWSRGTGLSFEPFLRFIRKLILDEVHAVSNDNYQQKRERVLEIKPIRILWAYLTIADHLLQIIIKVRTSILLNNIIICDRYIYDTFVDVTCDLGQNIGSIAQKVIENIVPSPAITFRLNNKLHGSSNNDSPMKSGANNCKRDAYLNYSPKRNFVLIDTTKPVTNNRINILEAMLRTYYSQK